MSGARSGSRIAIGTIAAGVLALGMPGQAWAQEPVTPADPTVRWSDVTSATVIVPDCQGWEPSIVGCAVRALPPSVCVFDSATGKQAFEILAAALALSPGEAPPPSNYSTAAFILQLRDGREMVVRIPLTPSLEAGGYDHVWITYGDRRVRLGRAAWDEISDLAQSPGCVRQPPSWAR